MPAEHLPLVIELLGDVLTAPALREGDVDNERQVILEELAMDDDLPEDVAHSLLAEALFPDHPLGRETAGTAESVEAITPDDVREFFGRWYRPSAMVVAVAGAVDHDDVVAEVEQRFPAAESAPSPARVAPHADPHPIVVDRRRSEQAQVALGFRGLARLDADREALDVTNHILGGGLSSRLFEEIREQRGLAYAVGSGTSSYADAGALTIAAGTGPGQVPEVLRLIDVELDKLRAGGITPEELDVAVGYLTGAYVMGLEDTGSRMARLGALLTTTGAVRPVAEQVERWRAVTTADVDARHRTGARPTPLAGRRRTGQRGRRPAAAAAPLAPPDPSRPPSVRVRRWRPPSARSADMNEGGRGEGARRRARAGRRGGQLVMPDVTRTNVRRRASSRQIS